MVNQARPVAGSDILGTSTHFESGVNLPNNGSAWQNVYSPTRPQGSDLRPFSWVLGRCISAYSTRAYAARGDMSRRWLSGVRPVSNDHTNRAFEWADQKSWADFETSRQLRAEFW